MEKCDEFEWIEFNELANSYLNEDCEAKKRTGIIRYYYGTFCTARDFINEKELYLNENSKEIMTSKKADVHNETSKIFRNHNGLNKNQIGKFISKDLNK